jgi:hypothetical protein
MVWTAPMTAVANTLLTASQFNVHVRNNLLETEASRATAVVGATAKLWFAEGSGRSAEHLVKDHNIDTSETTTSESYVDLVTVGPHVEMILNIGCMVMMNCQLGVSNQVNDAMASYEVFQSVGNMLPPNDAGGFVSEANTSRSIHRDGLTQDGNNVLDRCGVTHFFAGLPAKDLYVVRMKYKVSASAATGTFTKRRMAIMAL